MSAKQKLNGVLLIYHVICPMYVVCRSVMGPQYVSLMSVLTRLGTSLCSHLVLLKLSENLWK